MALTTLVSGFLPAAIAAVGGLFVDVVANAFGADPQTLESLRSDALYYIFLEAGLVVLLTGAQRINTVCQSILRVLLGNKINVMILEKALTLELAHFEDAEYYDKLVRARREASSRPLSLVIKTFDLFRDIIVLISIGIYLFQFSPYAVLLLGLAGIPSFLAEAKFSGEAFRIHRRRSAERRMQIYLEMVLTREDGVKEVKLLQLGKLFLERYVDIFRNIYKEDKSLVLRRGFWGYVLGLLASAAFYFAYGWVGFAAIAGAITIGQMTMYIAQFRLGQNAVTNSLTSINGMYEDNLYLSNLTEYLSHMVPEQTGEQVAGPNPADGIRFENVSFYYPGSDIAALKSVDLHITPGESLAIVGENGSGKTTLIKLLTRLYTPSEGKIFLEGLELKDWDIETLRQKIGVIFQDFAKYQLIVGENIGIGDVENIEELPKIEEAARKGMADVFVKDLPSDYQTQLGTWFKDGKELSGGQWQKIALSRAFMRSKADVLILDEPTAAIDAKAEAEIFAHFRDLTANRISIIISHRFSTVRMADHIIVLEKAEIHEQGSHEELLKKDGQYAHLFKLQAQGYK
ncbi:MAG: ABC transporter ATP-binding protein [Gammaproteobacteria bacterium]|nr:ABC transporter ATP-binding protein [Gammaproteobacteria bacterium]MBT3860112.1 ABC transporter ATP-binding protein [Gammaproteobacteria bacterium]MBT3987404.1 ABC transporter ATP-binding protein [Gammaproteobacteria bacterium]MBT4256535.1 ABC transporter ATP-binding protein [Gammaproteobacteria bacterium]MBT4581858.1 ABC transporter ATP-binding protein [Gammaproteobacteria bacterium]